jgi:hypothetical protein
VPNTATKEVDSMTRSLDKTVRCVVFVLILAGGLPTIRAAEPTIDQPRVLMTQTPLVSAKRVIVAAPRTPHGQALGKSVHQALVKLGARVELLSDPPGDTLQKADGPVILIGNLADSRCVGELYYRSLCATDLWYPGPGGYEVRTLCNPLGTGHNVIQIGYSDQSGARAAGGEFLTRVKDPLPHLLVLKATRLPMGDQDVERLRSEPLPKAAWQVANEYGHGDDKGYLYYLTGDAKLGEEYRAHWRAIIEAGYIRTTKVPQPHLFSLGRILPWRLVEHTNLFSSAERLAITRFLYGWAQSDEGFAHVVRSVGGRPVVPRHNHALIPALALAYTADYFATYYPKLPGPEVWRPAAAAVFAPYGPSWKSFCDGLCHGWYLSQPTIMGYALLDPKHSYFQQGGARKAADCAMAVVNNDGWMPSAGDSDMNQQFPGAVLQMAAAYYRDGRYAFVSEQAPVRRRFSDSMFAGLPRAFASGVAAKMSDDMVGISVVPVDELIYRVWERAPDQAGGAVATRPSAPIEQCFDKLAVRSGWNLRDDYLLIDGLGGGGHSYDDAAAILDYARLGLSLIIQEDDLVFTAPEHHSAATIVKDGEVPWIPAFASLEDKRVDQRGNAYVRIRLKDYAGADWVREIHVRRGSCMVVCDTAIAKQPGDFAFEVRCRTPARLALDGSVARCRRTSPCVGDVEFCIESSCEARQLAIEDVPIQLVYQGQSEQRLWKERYRTNEMVLTALVARQTARLQPGECLRTVHLAQAAAPGEPQLHLAIGADGEIGISDGHTRQTLATAKLGRPAPRQSRAEPTVAQPTPLKLFDAGGRITAVNSTGAGALVAGTETGKLVFLDAKGQPVGKAEVAAPVRDIGVARAKQPIVAVGHGPNCVTAFDTTGRRLWTTQIERDPCPWPWWELPTPAAVQVAGGVDRGEPFFIVGCGDIQVRCLDATGKERWRWRYNEGVPGRIRIAQIDRSGRPSIAVGGDILSDVSHCRILDPDGRQLAHLSVEGWTSMLTALRFGPSPAGHLLACGASRGANLHLFELAAGWKELWQTRLGGQVTGIEVLGNQGRLIVGTSQGFLICYDLRANVIWRKMLAGGVRCLARRGADVLVADSLGQLHLVTLAGDVRRLSTDAGAISIMLETEAGVYMVAGTTIWRL